MDLENDLPAEELYAGILQVKDKLAREILMIEFCHQYFPAMFELLTGAKKLGEVKLQYLRKNG